MPIMLGAHPPTTRRLLVRDAFRLHVAYAAIGRAIACPPQWGLSPWEYRSLVDNARSSDLIWTTGSLLLALLTGLFGGVPLWRVRSWDELGALQGMGLLGVAVALVGVGIACRRMLAARRRLAELDPAELRFGPDIAGMAWDDMTVLRASQLRKRGRRARQLADAGDRESPWHLVARLNAKYPSPPPRP